MADPQAEKIKELEEKADRAESSRKHTQDWYARHYGKVEDWARKRLPEPWRTEYFNCVANGIWGHDDVGETYMSQAGTIVPSGYFKMDSAAEQLMHDQTIRAELAEARSETLLQALRNIRRWNWSVTAGYMVVCNNGEWVRWLDVDEVLAQSAPKDSKESIGT